MAKPAPKTEIIKKSDKRWQSDVIVDMIKRQLPRVARFIG
jgi:hypothetical protein